MSHEKLENLKQISWEFKEAKTTKLTHGYHPFHGKFIPQIPNALISELTDEGDTVLDPFCGSGTALVEANVLSRNVIGNDMSPLAFLLTSVKTTKYDLNKLQIYFEKIKNSNVDSVLIPDFPDREIWYNETTLNELGQIWYRINKFVNQEEEYFNFFRVAFSSILKKVANKSEKWNWTFIGDNVKPKINKYQNAHQAFNKSVIQMMSGLEEFLNNSTSSTIKVFQEDTRQLDLFLTNKVDMVVTSPPYCFAVDFNKYFRLSYYWFNWDISFYKDNEIGARSKRGKKSALDDYFTEMEQSISVISRVLKSERYCCFTLGNSTRSKKSIDTVKEIISIAKSKGLLLVLNTDRFLSQQTMAQKRIPKESVLVFRNS